MSAPGWHCFQRPDQPRLGGGPALALGEKERAQKVIDEVPEMHPFELRYTKVEKVDWETCEQVLDAGEKWRVLSEGWG